MTKDTIPEAEVLQFRQEIWDRMRARIREAIEVVLNEELEVALGADRHERTDRRRGSRNGSRLRRVATSEGLQELKVPRGRLLGQDGRTREFRSQMLPRDQRRTKAVDDAILGI